MEKLGNKKRSSINGTNLLKEDSFGRSTDDIDGAFCGKRRDSDSEVSTEPKTFECVVPEKLGVGKMIKIEGAVPFGIERFQINLCCGNSDNVAVHLSVRFHSRNVVRNTFRGGIWEKEEKDGPFPFESGKEFCVYILVQTDSYHIAVNGQHCWVFAHRLPYESITNINAKGPVTVHDVRFLSIGQKDQQETSDIRPVQPLTKPTVPFSYTINGGLNPGMKLCINGRPFVSAYKFTINLQCGCGPYPPPDIAFHFDVREFNRTVVQNTRRNNNWEEEVTARSFLFQPGVPFDMVISVESDKYVVTVNGNLFTEYKHRITQLSSIDTLRIENDIVVSSINFQ